MDSYNIRFAEEEVDLILQILDYYLRAYKKWEIEDLHVLPDRMNLSELINKFLHNDFLFQEIDIRKLYLLVFDFRTECNKYLDSNQYDESVRSQLRLNLKGINAILRRMNKELSVQSFDTKEIVMSLKEWEEEYFLSDNNIKL